MSKIMENENGAIAAAREALGLAGIARSAGLPQAVSEGLDALESQLADARRIIRQQAEQLLHQATDESRRRESRSRIAEMANRKDAARQAAAEARKAYEAAVADHFALESALDDPRPRLPFGADPEPKLEPKLDPDPDPAPAPEPEPDVEEPECLIVAYEDDDDLENEL